MGGLRASAFGIQRKHFHSALGGAFLQAAQLAAQPAAPVSERVVQDNLWTQLCSGGACCSASTAERKRRTRDAIGEKGDFVYVVISLILSDYDVITLFID